MKLGTLRSYADRLEARYVATGHYARLSHDDDGVHLFRGTHAKDQAYALAQLTAAQLAGLLLPLGELTKEETRAHAVRLGLPVHDKADSQDICFVEGGDYRDVLTRHGYGAGERGEIRDTAGVAVGAHDGIAHYTVGQRAGLGGADAPRYVTRVDATTNTIVIGREEELFSSGLVADELNLIRPERFASDPDRAETDVLAMIRYRATPVPARARIDADGSLQLRFPSRSARSRQVSWSRFLLSMVTKFSPPLPLGKRFNAALPLKSLRCPDDYGAPFDSATLRVATLEDDMVARATLRVTPMVSKPTQPVLWRLGPQIAPLRSTPSRARCRSGCSSTCRG